MNLSLHKNYSEITLQNLNSSINNLTEIRNGSFANDLLYLTDKYVLVLCDSLNETIDSKTFEKKMLFEHEQMLLDGANIKLFDKIFDYVFESLPLFQSHCGYLSALHSMANYQDIPAHQTRDKILKWLNLLQEIFLSSDPSILNKKTPTFPNENDDFNPALNFPLSTVLDTSDINIAKNRALGMILHIIHDSFTKSHCHRNTNTLKIESFHHFMSQKYTCHAEEDKKLCYLEKEMLVICKEIVEALLNQNTVNFEQYFMLSNPETLSSHGGYN